MNNPEYTASKTAGGESPAGQPSPKADAAEGASDLEDAALVQKAAAGSAAAFEELFVKHRQRIFALAWRLLRNEEAALDVVQDAFVRAYERLKNLRGETQFYPWLRRIAVNSAFDHLRHLRRGVEVELDEQHIGMGGAEQDEPAVVAGSGSEADSPARKAELAEFNAALSEALLKLSDSHRAVFMLHAAEGMSYKEIAEALDCNIGTVMSRLFYARKRLQGLLAPYLGEM